MTIRLYVARAEMALVAGAEAALPAAAARHAQVRRVQPGEVLRLFDGSGCEWPAEIVAIGRSELRVRVGASEPVDRELPIAVTLAVAMPANERMDALVEKATELGVACIQPLQAERSVLRLSGERAERKRAHWQAIAVAACEQCGRARVPMVAAIRTLADWLPAAGAGSRLVLSLRGDALPPPRWPAGAPAAVVALSGPEGGLTAVEEDAARERGFAATALGPRVLRADTAPLAVLAWLALGAAGGATG